MEKKNGGLRIRRSRLLAGVVAFSLCLVVFSITTGSAAAFEGGSGTESDPYQIANVDQLQAMENDLDAHYVLVDDIDASETENWNSGKGFDPIGDNNASFKGSFNGQRYEIENLYIDRNNENYVGLFGYVEAEIENVGLVDVDITGYTDVGGLAGRNGWKVSGSYVTGSVSGWSGVGGLIGHNFYSTVSDSYSTSHVGGYASVGGILGKNKEGELSGSYSTGDVNGKYTEGGLVGYNPGGVVDNSYWNTETSDQDGGVGSGGDASGAYGRTTEEMTWEYADNTYVDWDFDGTWMDGDHELVEDHEGNTGYPALLEEHDLTIGVGGEGSTKAPPSSNRARKFTLNKSA